MIKKAVYNKTLRSEVPMKAVEADGSCRSKLQSSTVFNPQSVEESSYSNEMSNDIQSLLPQSSHLSLSNKT